MGAGSEQVGRTPSGKESGPREELQGLVEEGYALFRAHRPAVQGVCRNCCMYPDVEARILDWPVREIPLHDIRDWYSAAADDPFPAQTMRWFLPRVLDLIADGREVASVGFEPVLMRLRASGFPADWSEEAGDFMGRFAAAMLATAAAEPEAFREPRFAPIGLEELLCMFALGGVDLGPALARLDALPTPVLVDALARDWVFPWHDISVSPFWEGGPAKDLVFGWLTSEPMLGRMLAHGTGTKGEPETRDNALHAAEAILRWREAMGAGDQGGGASQ